MTDRPTPETALILRSQPNNGFGLEKSQCIAQWYDHASKLERQREAAVALLRAWVAGCGDELYSNKQDCKSLLDDSATFLARLEKEKS